MVAGSTCMSCSMSGSRYVVVCIVHLHMRFGGLPGTRVASSGEGFGCRDGWFDSILVELLGWFCRVPTLDLTDPLPSVTVSLLYQFRLPM